LNATAWVAIAGIGATLLAGLLGPALSERMRRKSTRLDRRLERRLDIYADLLSATARFADNAMTWSALPQASLKETDDQDLDRIVSQIRVVGSKKVHQRFEQLKQKIHKFNRLLFHARDYHDNLRDGGGVDDQTSIKQRMTLASIADEIVKEHKELESLIRKEIGS
jgi:hypothetical protein